MNGPQHYNNGVPAGHNYSTNLVDNNAAFGNENEKLNINQVEAVLNALNFKVNEDKRK